MAFGSWIKKIAKKVGGFFKDKAIPAVKKVMGVVKKVAPVVSKVGGAIGDKFGNVLSRAGEIAEESSDKIYNVADKVDRYVNRNKMSVENVGDGSQRLLDAVIPEETDGFKQYQKEQMMKRLDRFKLAP